MPATLLKKRLWQLQFLRTPFLQNTPGRILLWELVVFYTEVKFSYLSPCRKRFSNFRSNMLNDPTELHAKLTS